MESDHQTPERQEPPSKQRSLAEIVGPWINTGAECGLAERVRAAWAKPIGALTNHELATCLRQDIAPQHTLPLAKERLAQGFHDDSELYDEELRAAVDDLTYRQNAEREHQRIMASRFHHDSSKTQSRAGTDAPHSGLS